MKRKGVGRVFEAKRTAYRESQRCVTDARFYRNEPN